MRKVMIEKDTYKFYCKFSCKFSCKCYCKFCLIHRYGIPICRIQHGIKCVQVDGKD